MAAGRLHAYERVSRASCQVAVFIVVGLILLSPLRFACRRRSSATRAPRRHDGAVFARGVTQARNRMGVMIFVAPGEHYCARDRRRRRRGCRRSARMAAIRWTGSRTRSRHGRIARAHRRDRKMRRGARRTCAAGRRSACRARQDSRDLIRWSARLTMSRPDFIWRLGAFLHQRDVAHVRRDRNVEMRQRRSICRTRVIFAHDIGIVERLAGVFRDRPRRSRAAGFRRARPNLPGGPVRWTSTDTAAVGDARADIDLERTSRGK